MLILSTLKLTPLGQPAWKSIHPVILWFEGQQVVLDHVLGGKPGSNLYLRKPALPRRSEMLWANWAAPWLSHLTCSHLSIQPPGSTCTCLWCLLRLNLTSCSFLRPTSCWTASRPLLVMKDGSLPCGLVVTRRGMPLIWRLSGWWMADRRPWRRTGNCCFRTRVWFLAKDLLLLFFSVSGSSEATPFGIGTVHLQSDYAEIMGCRAGVYVCMHKCLSGCVEM